MKVLLLSEYNRLSLTEQPRPDPAPDELLIQVAACGICGSDVHGYRRLHRPADSADRHGTRSRRRDRRHWPRGQRLGTRRSRYLRFHHLLRRLRLLPPRRHQSLRQPPGARRLLRRLPPRTAPSPNTLPSPPAFVYRLPDTFSFADAAHASKLSPSPFTRFG